VEGEAADQQQQRVDRGQQQLQLIVVAGGQRVDGPEGEIRRKEPGEGHPIGNQEGGQPKHAVVGMAFRVGVGALICLLSQAVALDAGHRLSPWPRVHRSRPLLASKLNSPGITP
jgi:hypothetical protein